MFETFTVNSEADPSGTFLQGHLVTSYQQIVEILGEPIEGGDYKISGEWILTSEEGRVVTLYDWKSTHLYDQDLPSVEEFRQLDQHEFHIGAADRATAASFQSWFMAQITSRTLGGKHE
jgi:hypothetical protein